MVSVGDPESAGVAESTTSADAFKVAGAMAGTFAPVAATLFCGVLARGFKLNVGAAGGVSVAWDVAIGGLGTQGFAAGAAGLERASWNGGVLAAFGTEAVVFAGLRLEADAEVLPTVVTAAGVVVPLPFTIVEADDLLSAGGIAVLPPFASSEGVVVVLAFAAAEGATTLAIFAASTGIIVLPAFFASAAATVVALPAFFAASAVAAAFALPTSLAASAGAVLLLPPFLPAAGVVLLEVFTPTAGAVLLPPFLAGIVVLEALPPPTLETFTPSAAVVLSVFAAAAAAGLLVPSRGVALPEPTPGEGILEPAPFGATDFAIAVLI